MNPTGRQHSPLSAEERDRRWRDEVYVADGSPQLTLRSTLTGVLLGCMLALSNLYAGLKTGWSFSIAITACILSFSFWRIFKLAKPGLRSPGILEDNCMQSTASAAGYTIVALLVSAIPAYLMVTGVSIRAGWLILWIFFSAALGLMLFIPFKRQLVNDESLVFPSGVAAAETLRGLHAKGTQPLRQARGLFAGMGLGALGSWLGTNNAFGWWRFPRIPDSLFVPGSISGVSLAPLTVGLDLAGVSLAGGALIGIRISLWMLAGSSIVYLVLAPWLVSNLYVVGELSYRTVQNGFALWLGASLMVGASLADLFFQRHTMGRAFSGLWAILRGRSGSSADDPVAEIEMPDWWFLVGLGFCVIGLAVTGILAFAISPLSLLVALILSLLFVVVATRAVGETDLIPVGQLGKLAQLSFGGIAPRRLSTNLMATGMSVSSAACAADLATNLKCGRLLGGNPRKQFQAQLLGTLAGALVVVPAFYVLVPDVNLLGTAQLPAPAAAAWRAIAELMSSGLSALAPAARLGLLVGLSLGLILSVISQIWPDSKWTPSAFGLGLGMVIPFSQSTAFVLGALLAIAARKVAPARAEAYTVPVASGIIAGESLLGVMFGTLAALGLM